MVRGWAQGVLLFGKEMGCDLWELAGDYECGVEL